MKDIVSGALHLISYKKEIKDFPKLPSATSFKRKMLYEIQDLHKKLREDKEKKGKNLKDLLDQLIEQQKLTMKVLEAITERIKE